MVYADQFGGRSRKKIPSVNEFERIILSINENRVGCQHENSQSTFDTWKNHLEQVDDVSLIRYPFLN